MKKNPFAFIASQIEANLPESIRPLTDEAKQTVRGAISEKLSQFDLVPREEFEQQERLLMRAEQRVAALEARVNELEHARYPAGSTNNTTSPLPQATPVTSAVAAPSNPSLSDEG